MNVLEVSREEMERRHRLMAVGFALEELPRRVAEILRMEVEDIGLSAKYARIVPARSVLCYWAVRELGMRETQMARWLKLTRPRYVFQ